MADSTTITDTSQPPVCSVCPAGSNSLPGSQACFPQIEEATAYDSIPSTVGFQPGDSILITFSEPTNAVDAEIYESLAWDERVAAVGYGTERGVPPSDMIPTGPEALIKFERRISGTPYTPDLGQWHGHWISYRELNLTLVERGETVSEGDTAVGKTTCDLSQQCNTA